MGMGCDREGQGRRGERAIAATAAARHRAGPRRVTDRPVPTTSLRVDSNHPNDGGCMSLHDALQVATEAAIAAGALIRADFHRATGPRGHGHHAEVDTEAERVIRGRLTAEFAEWAYTGEETGSTGPRDAEYRWLVDPNDGTAAYLKGWRGSAVSIGLVRQRDGMPVLGVVYSPLAPDDAGDLVTW